MKCNQFFKSSSRVFVIGLFVFSSYNARAEQDAVQVIETAISSETQEVQILTEEIIKDFYAEAAKVQLEGAEPTLAFLKKHTHDTAKTKLHMRTLMPSKPPVKSVVTSDKTTMLAETKDAYEKGSVDSVETEIISVEISEDGKSASVVEKTALDFTLAVSDTKKVIVNSQQSCDTSIVLSKGIIQTKDSECDVEVNVKPVE